MNATGGVLRRAVILTAIRVESEAVLKHLPGYWEVPVNGTTFSVADYNGWQIAVAETSAGNAGAAVITERAINHFEAEVALFVGVAGGVKDVVVGDVVVGRVMYAYDKGKETEDGFLARSDPYRSAYDLEQIAVRRDVEAECQEVLSTAKIVPGVVLAGEKVIGTTKSEFWAEVGKRHSDATAVEMEGHGFGLAVHQSCGVRGLLLRGISDLLDGKQQSDEAGGQEKAAANAAALAFAVLKRVQPPRFAVHAVQERIVEISAVGTGFDWSGSVTVDQAGQVCSRKDFIAVLRIGFPPQHCRSPLRDAILRLLLHVDVGRIEATDMAAWEGRLKAYVQDSATTYIDTHQCPWTGIAALGGAPSGMPEGELAERIEDALDGATLEKLDDHVRLYLSGGHVPGLPCTDPALADDLLDLWDDWRSDMTTKERRRFLDMLLHFEDGGAEPGVRIGVGPKSVVTCMLPATVLALAVIHCGGGLWTADGASSLRPHEHRPGNLGNGTVFGHCCGASMVKAQPLDHHLEALVSLPWESTLVMLGNVKTSLLLAQLRTRSLQAPRSAGFLDDATPPQIVPLGFDGRFSAAVTQGRDAVRAHLVECVKQVRAAQLAFLDQATEGS
ncbi:MAG: ABC-three component system protein [Rhodospirillaceae bacterium]